MTPDTSESKPQSNPADAGDMFSKIDARPSDWFSKRNTLPPDPTEPVENRLSQTLQVLFPREAVSKAWLCAFGTNKAPNWTGTERKNWRVNGVRAMPTQNCYVCNGTYKDGTKRAKSNVEAVHFYVFDDVGSKVSFSHVHGALSQGQVVPALEIETSPGNETWLVAAAGVDTPEQIDRYTALQRAMGRKGLTDPAMKDTTRYVRLPFGINDKQKYLDAVGNAPKVRALAIRHAKRWGVDELAKALGIDLDKEIESEVLVSQARTGSTVMNSGNDPYVRALEELGLVQAQKPNGWLEITCPWEHEHTTRGLTGTGYLPNAGWECHHGHCQGRSTEDFKAELRRQLDAQGKRAEGFLAGASFDDDVGISEDRVRELMDALGVVPDGEDGSRSGASGAFLDQVVYVKNSDRYYEIGSGTFMNRNGLNTSWMRALMGVLQRNKQGQITEQPSGFFARSDGTKIADVPVYWPGKPVLFTHDGQVRLNIWRAPTWKRKGRKIATREVKPWLKLVLDLCNGNRVEARVLLDMLALVVAEQDWKPGFGIILKGTQGIGKDLALSVLSRALGHTNFAVITPDRIGTRFNVDTEKRAIVVNEMKMTTRGSLTAHDQYNALKTLVSPMPEWVRVERKGIDAYMIPNRAAWFFTTNEDAPLAMDEADRRFFVIECKRKSRRDAAFYEGVVDWLDALDGYDLVSEWLEQRGQALGDKRRAFLSGNAPMNAAKQDIIAMSPTVGRSPLTDIRAWIEQEQDNWPELVTTEDVLAEMLVAAKSGLAGLSPETRAPQPRQMGWLLGKLGWVKVSGSNVVPMPSERGGKTRHVWARKNAAQYQGQKRGELARKYAEGWGFQPPKGVAHGSADGSNVVALPKAGPGADQVGQAPSSQDKDGSYPF